MLYNELIFFSSTYYRTWELTDEEGGDNEKKKDVVKLQRISTEIWESSNRDNLKITIY